MRKKDLEFEIEELKRENEKLRDTSKIPELEAKLHRATVRLWLEKSKNNDYMKAIKLRESIIESTKASGIETAKQLAITEKALELACLYMCQYVIPCPDNNCGMVERYKNKNDCYLSERPHQCF